MVIIVYEAKFLYLVTWKYETVKNLSAALTVFGCVLKEFWQEREMLFILLGIEANERVQYDCRLCAIWGDKS